LLVFGARAGRAAAEYASSATADRTSAVLALGRAEQDRLERDLTRHAEGSERIAHIRTEMQETMETSAGIYRDGDSLAEAADKLRELRNRFGSACLNDHSRAFNTELVAVLELSCMLDVAECIIACALAREESRGAHQRSDFPARNDQRFLAHSVIHRETDGSGRVSYLPVTITRWPPGERVYGR
jgi:fumarate reductase flavoprotein subunit